MARLGDVPKLLRSVGVVTFARRVWAQVKDDSLFTWASALAYAWLFAIFPFMLFLLSLIPYLDALVLLIGAEINSEIDFGVLKIRRGTRDFRGAQDQEVAAPTAI